MALNLYNNKIIINTMLLKGLQPNAFIIGFIFFCSKYSLVIGYELYKALRITKLMCLSFVMHAKYMHTIFPLCQC
jgi:hypothetical protein